MGGGGGGGVGNSSAMASAVNCAETSTPITGYPVQYGNGGNGVVIIAFFKSGCPGDVLQYEASTQLVIPVPPNTA